MLRLALVAALVSACSGPTRRPTPTVAPPDAAVTVDAAAPDAAPEPVVEADFELPVAGTPVSDCRRPRPAKVSAKAKPAPDRRNLKRKVYDFTTVRVLPVRHGPHLSERPYVGYDRTLDNARSALAARSDHVTQCWRWASARGAKETTLAVELTLDARGSTSGFSVSSAQAGDDELIACVKDMLAPSMWAPQRVRATRLFAFLAFNNDMPPGPKPPTRPKPPAAYRHSPGPLVCPPADPSVLDEVYLPVLVVTNFDESRVAADAPIPLRRQACDSRTREVDKATIRIGLRAMQGTLDTCYADALARTPALAGDIGAKLLLDTTGYARDVAVSGAGDDALHACFTAAIDALWVVPSMPSQAQEIEVNLAYTLTPARPTSNDPHVLVDEGDIEAALAVSVGTLRSPHLPFQGCLAHGEILYAMSRAVPWLDDDRVRIAIENLAKSALALPLEQGRACVEKSAGMLDGYVRVRHNEEPSNISVMRHLERYEAVLPLAAFFDWGPRLRWHHAHRLLRTARSAEGEDTLAELASDSTVGPAVTAWLEQRAKRADMLHDLCSR